MNKTIAIVQKELKQIFYSPIAYIVLFVTLEIFNVFFYLIIDQNAEATLRDVFQVMEFMLVFIVPLFTMRIFAEERQSGTFEFLMTLPVSSWTIILGKFLATTIFFSIFLLLTSPYYFILEVYSSPDRMAILVGYIGIFLEIMSYIAIGIFFSALTKSQVVAAISSYVVIFMLYFSVSAMKYVQGFAAQVIRYTGIWSHSENLIAGVLQTQDVVYFLSLIIFPLILTRLALQSR